MAYNSMKMTIEKVKTINGKDGQDGKSAYEIAVDSGYVGTQEEWLESLKGEDGVTPDLSTYALKTDLNNYMKKYSLHVQNGSADNATISNSECLASGDYSFAANESKATAPDSSSFNYAQAKGARSIAFNNSTASSPDQVTMGNYNVEDTEGKYMFIIGNGKDANNRSNAMTVDKYGHIWCQYGQVRFGGTGYSNATSWTLTTDSFPKGFGKSDSILSIVGNETCFTDSDYSAIFGYQNQSMGVNNQFIMGKYNKSNSSAAFIMGNGTDTSNRSNALEIDWSGNASFSGTVEATALILKSSTAGSTKKFKITVDDSGVLSATEITE